MMRAQEQWPCPCVCTSAVCGFGDGRSRNSLLPGPPGRSKKHPFLTGPGNGRGYQKATRSGRSSVWAFAAFSLTKRRWARPRECCFLGHRSRILYSTNAVRIGTAQITCTRSHVTPTMLLNSAHASGSRNLGVKFFELLEGLRCLTPLVKAIRVRVRCLASSLVVPDPDHLFIRVPSFCACCVSDRSFGI
jgi:hypothetical protein